MYPYSKDNSLTLSGTSNLLATVVNDIQYGVADSYSPGQNIWIGRDTGLELSFKSLLSGIKFTFSRDDITRVTIQGNNGENIAGYVRVTMDSGVPVVNQVVTAKKSVSLIPQDGETFQKGAVYRALFLPTNFTQGLTVTFYTSTGCVGTRTYGSLNFERNKPKNAENADANVIWKAMAEYVKMGPGMIWATKNVGADSPEEYGDYFAWGETTPKTSFSWDNYKWGTQTSLTKYVTNSGLGTLDNLTTLQPEDDAATANLGGKWRTPTREDWKWLNDNCEWTRRDDGYLVTSRVPGYEGNSIFLPAGGWITSSGPGNVGIQGFYWSSNLRTSYASKAYTYNIYPNAENPYSEEYDEWRYLGCMVRPVYVDLINGHDYVEMGDGLKWATTNVGADLPEEYGDYFAWGETAAKSDYSWSTYFDNPSGDGETFTKYALDKKTQLDLSDDAASANWGGTWRMPTDAEWTALRNEDNFDWAWTGDYNGTGVKGRIVTSKVPGYEGNQIFLPAAGYRNYASLSNVGALGDFWSSSLSTSDSYRAWYVYFNSSNVYRGSSNRSYGRSVRPVSE
ncbi:MAG: hypothetical protein IKS22_05585 [Bacteroidales bacterium]|nr:hypothetical protein [Bacteroidales bacterium]